MSAGPRAAVAIAALAAIGAGLAACERAPARRNVVLIVVDALRASHLGYQGYTRATTPFIDSLAAQSLDFRRAIAASSWTSPSVASIFSSLYPPAHGISPGLPTDSTYTALVFDEGFVTLAEVLRDRGYRTWAVVSNPWITQRLGFAQGFDVFLSPYADAPGPGNARARLLNKIVYQLLERDPAGEDSAAPFFLYVHYMDPHAPYEPMPRYRGRFDEAPAGDAHTDLSDPEVRRLVNLYDAEIRYLDDQIGKLFAFLEKRGLLQETVIVFTADHGEQFVEYGSRGHGHTVHNLEVHVPLLLRIPGVRPAVFETLVSTVDIYPTLLEVLGIEVDHPIQGVSLMSALAQREERGVFSGMTFWANEKSFTRADGRKVVIDYEPGAPADPRHERRRRLYDSRGDYDEREPLDSEPELRELSAEFYRVYEESLDLRAGRTPSAIDLDPAVVERLERMGYFE